jgi:carbon monoxide dehydrogenase subunit G
MGMTIEKSFTVNAPADDVWAFLTDPRKVASCLPGAAITDAIDDKTYAGTMTVKVGPVTASYRGKMRFERLDPVAHEAEIVASGQETRGKGAADMRMSSRVIARGPAETEVVITSDVNVVGVLAQFGRGMIQDVSDQMFGKFSAAMRKQLEGDASGAAPGTAPGPAPGTAAASAAATAPAATPAAPATPTPPTTTPAASAPAAAPAPSAPAAAPTPPSPASPPAPAKPPIASRSTVAGADPPRATEEVLDLGAIGAVAAGRAAERMLHSGWFWVVVIAIVALLVLVFR